MGFPRQEYRSGWPFPYPGDLPWPRNWTWISWIAGRFFIDWAMRENHLVCLEIETPNMVSTDAVGEGFRRRKAFLLPCEDETPISRCYLNCVPQHILYNIALMGAGSTASLFPCWTSLRPHSRKKESEVTQWCLTLCDPADCSLPGSSVHGTLQARILVWIDISFSRESSWPRDPTRVSCMVGKQLTLWATREPQGSLHSVPTLYLTRVDVYAS